MATSLKIVFPVEYLAIEITTLFFRARSDLFPSFLSIIAERYLMRCTARVQLFSDGVSSAILSRHICARSCCTLITAIISKFLMSRTKGIGVGPTKVKNVIEALLMDLCPISVITKFLMKVLKQVANFSAV